MTTKHTLGPWTNTFNEQDPLSVGAPTPSGGLLVIAQAGAHTFEEAVANARLIAAAPDLLEALVRLSDRFVLNGVPEDGENQYEEALVAIAKARGEDVS